MGEGVGDGVEGEILDAVGDGDVECHCVEDGFEGEHEDGADQVDVDEAMEVVVLGLGEGFVGGLAELLPGGSRFEDRCVGLRSTDECDCSEEAGHDERDPRGPAPAKS